MVSAEQDQFTVSDRVISCTCPVPELACIRTPYVWPLQAIQLCGDIVRFIVPFASIHDDEGSGVGMTHGSPSGVVSPMMKEMYAR